MFWDCKTKHSHIKSFINLFQFYGCIVLYYRPLCQQSTVGQPYLLVLYFDDRSPLSLSYPSPSPRIQLKSTTKLGNAKTVAYFCAMIKIILKLTMTTKLNRFPLHTFVLSWPLICGCHWHMYMCAFVCMRVYAEFHKHLHAGGSPHSNLYLTHI